MSFALRIKGPVYAISCTVCVKSIPAITVVFLDSVDQRQTAVTGYFSNKPLLPFDLSCEPEITVYFLHYESAFA